VIHFKASCAFAKGSWKRKNESCGSMMLINPFCRGILIIKFNAE